MFLELIQGESNLKELQIKAQLEDVSMNCDVIPIMEFIASNQSIEILHISLNIDN